jgi:hypothetical protein
MRFCMLGKSSEVYALEDVDDDDDVDETVEDGRGGRLAQEPRLMVDIEYFVTSNGERNIIEAWIGMAITVRLVL